MVYLGYVVSRDGISPDLQKVDAVRDFPQPSDVRTLRSFLGLASYYWIFIAGFFHFLLVASPLFALTKKDAEFDWSSACQGCSLKHQYRLSWILVMVSYWIQMHLE